MYSNDERLRTVELYIKLGKRIGATTRQLCYPTQNSIQNWYQEFLESGAPQTYLCTFEAEIFG